jgi:RNA polymerase sigma-70 factor (ECF subfamily)
MRQAMRLTNNRRELSEDLVQATAVRAFLAWSRIDGENAGNWLAKVLTNLYRDVLRSRRRRPSEVLACDMTEDTAYFVESQPASEAPEPCTLPVAEWLEELPPVLRGVAELHFVWEMSGPEMAQVLDLPEGTVRTRLMRARRTLRTIAVHLN